MCLAALEVSIHVDLAPQALDVLCSAPSTTRPTVAVVRGIPDDATVATVRTFFSRFGAVTDVDLGPAATSA